MKTINKKHADDWDDFIIFLAPEKKRPPGDI